MAPSLRSWIARGAAALCAALALACRADAGAPYLCACTFVTDYDDDVKQEVEVCAPDAARAEAIGRGCAQAAAPGPVQRCTCRPAPGRGACSDRACRPTTAAAP